MCNVKWRMYSDDNDINCRGESVEESHSTNLE